MLAACLACAVSFAACGDDNPGSGATSGAASTGGSAAATKTLGAATGSERVSGVIERWDEYKGYGTIRPVSGGRSVAVQRDDFEDPSGIYEGRRVTYVLDTSRSRPRAVEVQ